MEKRTDFLEPVEPGNPDLEGYCRRHYLTKSKGWRIGYYALIRCKKDGKQRRIPLGRNEKRARKEFDAVIRQNYAGYDWAKEKAEKKAKGMTFSKWLDHPVNAKKSEADKDHLVPLEDFFGPMVISDDIDDVKYREYREKRAKEFVIRRGKPSKKLLSETTINKECAALRKFLLRARKKGFVDKIETFWMAKEYGRKRVLSAEQWAGFLAGAIHEWSRRVFRGAYLTAMSRSDLLKLKRTEIHERLIRPENGRAKTGEPFFVPITSGEMRELIDELKAEWRKLPTPLHPEQALAFTMPDGSPIKPSVLECHFRMARKAAGLDGKDEHGRSWFTLHDLRHCRITAWAFARIPTAAAMAMAGHKSVASHKKYQQMLESANELCDLVEQCMSAARTMNGEKEQRAQTAQVVEVMASPAGFEPALSA